MGDVTKVTKDVAALNIGRRHPGEADDGSVETEVQQETNPNGNSSKESGNDSDKKPISNVDMKDKKDASPSEDVYQLPKNKTLAIIVSNEVYRLFKPEQYAYYIEKEETNNPLFFQRREGGELDSEELEKLFKEMTFDVKSYKDCERKDINNLSKNLEDKYDSLICVFMGHGNKNVFQDVYYEKMNIDTIIGMFSRDNCKQLKEKPKIFIFNCCRGNEHDKDRPLSALESQDCDNAQPTIVPGTVPTTADTLVAYSCAHGYTSRRLPGHGSWYIQALVETFREHWRAKTVAEMLTITGRKVAEFGTQIVEVEKK